MTQTTKMGSIVAKSHVWTRQQYGKMVEAGVFEPDDRVQLLNGKVVEMTPQSSRHATAVRQAQVAFQGIFGKGFDLRCQLPLGLSEDSEPAPDLAGSRDYTLRLVAGKDGVRDRAGNALADQLSRVLRIASARAARR